MSAAKGPYQKLIGRNTQSYCTRAVRQASCDAHKRILFVVAAGADAFVAGRLGLPGKSGGRGQSRAEVARELTHKEVARAMRIYASAALIALGPSRDVVLGASGLGEAAFMDKWRAVFDYRPDDMEVFNQILLPASRSRGLCGLAEEASGLIDAALWRGDAEAAPAEAWSLTDALFRDVAAILNAPKEEAGHALCH
ncbi:MAG: hypothetical protein ACLGQH_12785 [Acidobacteriota bacterium]